MQSSPWERALTTPKLFKTILPYCTTPTLLTIRLVNSTWNHESTLHLLQRPSIDLHFTFDHPKNSFVLTSPFPHHHNNHLHDLNEFLQILSTSSNFPCRSYTFTINSTISSALSHNNGGLDSPEVQTFFDSHGPSVHHLQLDLFGDENVKENFTSVSTMRHLLLHQVPNLATLRLTSLPSQWSGNTESLLLPTQFLPNIKILGYSLEHSDHPSFAAHTQILSQILRAATNLEEYDRNTSIEPEHLDIILSRGQIRVIKKFDLYTDPHPWRCYFNVTQKLARAKPSLETLSIFSMDPRPNFQLNQAAMNQVTSILSKLLESSKDSLKRFVCYGHIGDLPDFQMPLLKSVDTIQFLVTCSRPESLMPLGFQWSLVPALRSVTFAAAEGWNLLPVLASDVDKLESLWSMYFWDVGEGKTVKKLVVSFQLPEIWMGKLVQLFPNLESLSLGNVKGFSWICETVWSLKGLKTLEIELDAGDDENSFPRLDAAFCGFSEVTCRKLQFQGQSAGGNKVDRVRRVHPSILDLTSLEKLRLKFNDESEEERQTYNLITRITTKFSFEPMQNVRVGIGVTARNFGNRQILWAALQPLGIPIEFL